MPTSINLAKYPEGMLDLLESICETRAPATIPYENGKKAKAKRLQWYGLIKALQINEHSLGPLVARLSIETSGPDKNILEIKFPPKEEDDFYKALAERHAAANRKR